MDALLYFGIWAGLIFLLMRFGCGAHVMGHGQESARAKGGATPDGGGEPRWIAPKKDADPVCGKTVSTDKAKPSVFDGNVYYFCSRECREVFEAAPDIYVRSEARGEARQLEHSHV